MDDKMFLGIALLLISCGGKYVQSALGSQGPNVAETKGSDPYEAEVKIYQMTQEEFQELEQTFKEIIADAVTEFCQDDSHACGVAMWDESYAFTSEHVVINNTDTKGAFFIVGYFVELPSNLTRSRNFSGNSSMLARQTVEEATAIARNDINDALNHYITGIGVAAYSPPPNRVLNIVLIIVGFAVLLLIIIIVIALHFWRKGQNQKEQRHKKLKSRKKRPRRKHEETQDSASYHGSKIGPAPYDNHGNRRYDDNRGRDGYEGDHRGHREQPRGKESKTETGREKDNYYDWRTESRSQSEASMGGHEPRQRTSKTVKSSYVPPSRSLNYCEVVHPIERGKEEQSRPEEDGKAKPYTVTMTMQGTGSSESGFYGTDSRMHTMETTVDASEAGSPHHHTTDTDSKHRRRHKHKHRHQDSRGDVAESDRRWRPEDEDDDIPDVTGYRMT